MPHNIRVNAMSPGAFTNSLDPFFAIDDAEVRKAFIESQPAELVAPVVAYLVHEDCEISGMGFDVSGESVNAMFLATSAAYVNPKLTIEDLRDHIELVVDSSQLETITQPTNPGSVNELASMLVRKPYVPR